MIDTQAIRNKILDLALRGQLTEQLPEDGTAEELYQQIQEEKRALIEVGKIKKEKPLPENTDSQELEMGETWEYHYENNIWKHSNRWKKVECVCRKWVPSISRAEHI